MPSFANPYLLLMDESFSKDPEVEALRTKLQSHAVFSRCTSEFRGETHTGRHLFDGWLGDERLIDPKMLRQQLEFAKSLGIRQCYLIADPHCDHSSLPEDVVLLDREDKDLPCTIYRLAKTHRSTVFHKEITAQSTLALKQVTSFIAHTPTMIIIIDKAHQVIAINSAAQREIMLNYGILLKPGDNRIEAFKGTDVDRPATNDLWCNALNGETIQVTIPFGEPGKRRRMYDVICFPLYDQDGTIIGAGQSAHDINAIYEAQQVAAASEKALREAQRLANVGSWELYSEDGRYTLSPQLYEIYGFDPKQPLPPLQEHFKMLGKETEEKLNELFRKTLETGEPYEYEYKFTRCNGEERWGRVNGERSVDETGKFFLRGTVQDITDRKRREEDDALREKSIAESQKLESLGLMAGSIAHDFNNIIMAVGGHIDLLAEQLDPLHPALTHAKEASEQCQRASELCRQLLAYTGRSMATVSCFEINEAIQSTKALFGLAVSKKVTVSFELTDGLPNISFDPVQFRQILMNLVINASEAIGEASGSIIVRTEQRYCSMEEVASPWINSYPEAGNYVVLTVTDDGCGMPQEIIEKIFTPFYSTKFIGRGLGLAAVGGYLRSGKGSVRVFSRPEEGTTFKVFFPVDPQALKAGRVSPMVPPSDLKKNDSTPTRCILIADDESPIRRLVSVHLQRAGWTVIEAVDGLDALDQYERHHKSIRVALIDVMMPGLTGDQVVERLHMEDPNLPVVLMSGYSAVDLTNKLSKPLTANLLQKPFNKETLLSVIMGAMTKGPNRTPTPV